MKMKTRNLLKKHTRDMIRWQLRMRDRFLTCGVTQSDASGFSVVTVPHRDVRSGTVEIFRDLASALQRHAAIVDRLRSSGWSIASYTQ
jgi:hypothetical protein